MESGCFRGLGSDVACRVALKPRRVAMEQWEVLVATWRAASRLNPTALRFTPAAVCAWWTGRSGSRFLRISNIANKQIEP